MKFSLVLSILAIASSAIASPLARYRRVNAVAVNATSSTPGNSSVSASHQSSNGNSSVSSTRPSSKGNSSVISFDNWKNIGSLKNFDGFFGSDNFDGRRNQEVIIVEQQQVCSRRDVVRIQQQLAIVVEFAKRLLLEQLCDVETQVIVLEQVRGRMRQFRSDLRRQSGRDVSFDSNISQLISKLVNSDGSLNSSDFGFSGHDIGQHSRSIGGSNWDDSVSSQNINEILRTISYNL